MSNWRFKCAPNGAGQKCSLDLPLSIWSLRFFKVCKTFLSISRLCMCSSSISYLLHVNIKKTKIVWSMLMMVNMNIEVERIITQEPWLTSFDFKFLCMQVLRCWLIRLYGGSRCGLNSKFFGSILFWTGVLSGVYPLLFKILCQLCLDLKILTRLY